MSNVKTLRITQMIRYENGMTNSITILGGGNMGGALAQRWQQAGYKTHVVERDETRRSVVQSAGIASSETLKDAPAASVLVLAIKPQQFSEMKEEIRGACGHSVLLSIMAGIPLISLTELCARAVRVMPNLPAIIGEGMSAAYAPAIDSTTRQTVTDLMVAVGDCIWVEDEALLHAVTGISGSGPGYVFAFMEALEAAGVTQGLTPEIARALVAQTLRGAALLAAESHESFATLRENVTSQGGTTAAALSVFSERGMAKLIGDAVAACIARSKELAS